MIPLVVGVVVVSVKPLTIVVTIRAEQIRVAVRNVQNASHFTTP